MAENEDDEEAEDTSEEDSTTLTSEEVKEMLDQCLLWYKRQKGVHSLFTSYAEECVRSGSNEAFCRLKAVELRNFVCEIVTLEHEMAVCNALL